MPNLLKRDRCQIPHAEPEDAGFDWQVIPLLPDLVPGLTDPPPSEVRAGAGRIALHVRFECAVDDPAKLAPPTPYAPLSEVERAIIDVFPHNDPTVRFRFQADYRGMSEASKILTSVGESSLEAVPDVWTKSENATGDWSRLHGLLGGGWFVELIIPWRTLGLAERPPVIGFGYQRVFRSDAWPKLDAAAWNGPRDHILLEPGEAVIGEDSGYPEELELDTPTFGTNTGRLALGKNWPERPAALKVWTEGRRENMIDEAVVSIEDDQDVVEFAYRLDRSECNHVDVFNPPRLIFELLGGNQKTLYRAALPMDRHLGIHIDEPYSVTNHAPRDSWLSRLLPDIPRLHRSNTNDGAPSDFCLMHEDGSVASNLMADDAWQRLAEIVERFESAEDRLATAMALVGQKSVTNLILGPMFFNAEGQHTYHSAMHEWMGPLSIMRYGGGPAVARAATLARLLQHVENPETGKPFVTRIVSLTRDGGPLQVVRTYETCRGLAPFVQEPGAVGAVAVDYRGSQTLLDPTGMVFFPNSDESLATIEEMLSDEDILRKGAGSYASIYSRVDIDEVRRHLPDRLLSKGVFPELCPNEDGPDTPFDPGYRQEFRNISGEVPVCEGFVQADGSRGVRDGSVSISWNEERVIFSIRVEGVPTSGFDKRDRATERVHVVIDTAHNHQDFHHFLAGLDGERGCWRETASSIQTLFKNLSTENHSVVDEARMDWKADFDEKPNGYEVTAEVPWAGLWLEGSRLPPAVGFNVWVDGRSPHYEQVFLSPPRHRLPADPFSFADLYLSDSPVTIQAIDFGVPTWGKNVGTAQLSGRDKSTVEVTLRARCVGGMERKNIESKPVTATVSHSGGMSVDFPFFVDPEEKMTSKSPQRLILSAYCEGREIFRGEWLPAYCQTPSIYERYGGPADEHPNPEPGEDDFLNKKIRYICARLPRLDRLTTREGAASDFMIRAEDGSVKFNLMRPGVLDEMGEYIAGLFDTDLDRILGMFYLCYHPQVGRHMSGGHRFMSMAGPLSILRGNFAGGGGNCGYHSRAFSGMAAHLEINGRKLEAHTVSIYGHAISAVEWQGSKALMDADVGHFMLTPDGTGLATIEEFRANPNVLTTAGPGELAIYFSFDLTHTSGYPGMTDEQFPGVFPPGAPKA